MPRRLCLGCGRLFAAGTGRAASRCRDCRSEDPHEQTGADRPQRAVVAAWVERHGWVCPGWGRPAHPSDDLTADHLVPGSNGGGFGVLCRSCNGRKGRRRAEPPDDRPLWMRERDRGESSP